MRTSEELQTMPHEELVKYALLLQDDIGKVNNNANYWHDAYHREVHRFTSFRNTVKPVVELIEIPKQS